MHRRATPGVDAGEGQRVARHELAPHDGVDAVAGHGDIGVQRLGALHLHRHALRELNDAGAARTTAHMLCAQATDRGIPQHTVQHAAVNAQLRLCIAGVAAAQLAVHELAVAREEAAIEVLDGLAFERVLQPERSEFAHRVGQQRDADAQRLELAHTLEHGAADAALVQRQREGEAGDAAADDRNMGSHGSDSL